MLDIVGVEVKCAVCGQYKKPVGRSAPMGLNYCEAPLGDLIEGCEGYRQDPQPGWLFTGERWSESFGDYPLPEESDCYKLVNTPNYGDE